MDEQRECIQGPTGGHWRDVVCNLCDFHGLVYVHGDGDDEWKTEEEKKKKDTNPLKVSI